MSERGELFDDELADGFLIGLERSEHGRVAGVSGLVYRIEQLVKGIAFEIHFDFGKFRHVLSGTGVEDVHLVDRDEEDVVGIVPVSERGFLIDVETGAFRDETGGGTEIGIPEFRDSVADGGILSKPDGREAVPERGESEPRNEGVAVFPPQQP